MDEKKIEEIRASCTYNIVLIGFMGDRKIYGGRDVSKSSLVWKSWKWTEIERQQSLSIPGDFEQYGEAYFRNLETKLLIEMQKKNGVILPAAAVLLCGKRMCAK